MSVAKSFVPHRATSAFQCLGADRADTEVHGDMGRGASSATRRMPGSIVKLRGILIARVSNKSQEDAFSLEAQMRQMRLCCERRGIEIVDERVEPGASAFTSDLSRLPILQQTLLDIEAGRANVLVVHESSRLARSEQLANHVLDRLNAVGASFVNTTQDIDYTTPEGRMFFNNEASMNAYHSRKTSQHSKKGKLEQFLQGLPVGRIHFGYVAVRGPDGETNRKVPPAQLEIEGAAVRNAYLDRALGRGYEALARDWNAMGLRPQSGKHFTRRSLQAILENPFYKGFVSHHGELMQGLHEPLVTEDEWAAAQVPKARVIRKRLPPLLAQGLASCFACGHALYPARPTKGPAHPGEFYAYYREPSRDFHLTCPDAGLLWPSAEPDALLSELMASLTMSAEWVEFVHAEAAKAPDDAAARRLELEESIRRVKKEFFNRRLDEDEYRSYLNEYERELITIPARRTDLVAAVQQFETFGELWELASPDARNEACRVVFESVVFDVRHRRIVEVRAASEFEPLFQLRQSLYVSGTPRARGSR